MGKCEMFKRGKPVIGMRGIHLDLKGLPPTPKRLLELLDLLAEARINCVLVEWEDTYPWTTYPELKCETAYSRKTVREFLNKAEKLSIQVVPLVQCLGHLENVLSRKRFAHLREKPDYVSELCPSQRESGPLIKSLIDDVLETHQGRVRFFHLGGDEAWFMGACPKCRKEIARNGKAALYLKQVDPLLDYLREKKITPILWDDMMRHWKPAELCNLAGRTDLMVWWYSGGVRPELEAAVQRFARAGLGLWGASAFKGADGVTIDRLNLKARAKNTLAWAERARTDRHFRGVVATGWSRYDTFRAPCEGLESSLDALVVAAAAMWDGRLPADYGDSAVSLLGHGKMRKLAGRRFTDCREATMDLDTWVKDTYTCRLQSWSSLASLAGESDRRSPYRDKELKEVIRKHLSEGRRLGAAWKSAHRGLVPDFWLDRYVTSRLLPVERYLSAIR